MRRKTTWQIAITSALTVGFSGFAAADVINGTDGDDTLFGTPEADVINGKEGNDTLRGGAGDDLMNGGPGNDFVFGDVGDDALNGGDGDDLIRGASGNDTVEGGDGNDIIDLVLDIDPGQLRPPCRGPYPPEEFEYDIARGGDGDDRIRWVSGPARISFAPIFLCFVGYDGGVNGGKGYDTIEVGIGSFAALSSDYVIEDATQPGYKKQLRSLVTGATLNFKDVEEIQFFDTTLFAPF